MEALQSQLRLKSRINAVQIINQHRHATIPPHILAMQQGASTLLSTKRVKRKHRFGATRPPVYFKFDCRVELSDGSTFVRQSPFPRVEWRYLRDQRVHPLWNPTLLGLVAQQADASGRVSRFNQRYANKFQAQSGAPVLETAEPEAESKQEVKEQVKDEQANAFDELSDLLDEFDYNPDKNAKVQTKRNKRY